MEYIKTGSRIKYYRNLLGISQKDLASTSLTKSMIYMLEKGNRKLTASTASLLAANFNTIAEKKGMRIQVSIKDLLMPDRDYAGFICSKMIKEAENQAFDISKYEGIIRIAEEYQLFEIAIKLYDKVAQHYYDEKDYYEAKEFLERSLALSLEHDLIEDSINIGNRISTCYYMLQDYDKAVDYCLKCHEQYNRLQIEDKRTKSKILYNIALYNTAEQNYEEAMKYIDELLLITQAPDSERDINTILKANIFLKMDKSEEALELFKQIISKDLKYLYIVQHNMAIAFKHLGKIEESIEFFNASIKNQLNSLSSETTFSLMALAEVYEKEKKYDEAIIFYEYAIKNANKFSQVDKLITCYESVFDILEGINRISKFEYYNNCILNFEKSSALKEDQQKRVDLLHDKYRNKTMIF